MPCSRRPESPRPYVVVGHSWDGLLARLFANNFAHLTAGVVLGSNKPPQDPKFSAAQAAEAALSTDS